MKLLTTMSRHCALFIFLMVGILNGCASPGHIIGTDQLTIDKIPSDKMSIVDVYIRKVGDGMNIKGKVKFKKAMIGIPLDHLVVTVIDPDGKVLFTVRTRYYRHGNPTKESDAFNFSLNIPVTVSKGSVIRLANENT